MIFTIAGKEILTSVKTVRFVVTMLVCCFLLPMSVWVLSTDYLREMEDYQGRVNLEDRRETGKNYQMGVNKPVAPLSPLFRGVSAESANTIDLKYFVGWNRPAASVVQSVTNDIFPTVDLTFVIGLILSAMALIFSFDSVSGEKAEATLRLIMSNSLPRYKIIVGKWLGLSGALLIPLLIGLLISLLIFFSISGVSYSSDSWMSLVLALVISVVYLSLFVLIGITVSTFTKNPSVSIFVCLGVWGLITIILPQTAIAVSGKVKEIPTAQQIEKDIRVAYNEFAYNMQRTNYEIIDEEVAKGSEYEVIRDRTSRNQMNHALENRRRANNIEREYWLKIADQERAGQYMSLASPYGSFNIAVIALADTGPAGQREFLLQAYDYGEKYFEDIWEKAYSDNSEFENWGDIFASQPKFNYLEKTFASKLELITFPLMSLLLYLIIILMVCVIAFNRYDVR